MHCRGPMGFSATGDEYCLRGDMALQGVETASKSSFMMRICAHTFRGSTRLLVGAASEASLSTKASSTSQSPQFISAVTTFRQKVSLRTKVESLLTSLISTPSWALATSSRNSHPTLQLPTFPWTPDHDEAFRKGKSLLLQRPILAHFNPALQVIIQTDASRLNGIGYALLQDHGQGRTCLVQRGSRFLTDTEMRYCTIELELLAAACAMSKCRHYLIGLPTFTLITDHRPLIPILNYYTLDAVENPRLHRLKEKVSQYVFITVWRPGKNLPIPDALSGAPVSRPTFEDETLCIEATTHLRSIVIRHRRGFSRDTRKPTGTYKNSELLPASTWTTPASSTASNQTFQLIGTHYTLQYSRIGSFATAFTQMENWSSIINALLSPQRSDAAPSLSFMTSTVVQKRQFAGHAKLPFGLALKLTSPAPSKPANRARSFNQVCSRNHFYRMMSPPDLSSQSLRTFSQSLGKPSLSLRTDYLDGPLSSPVVLTHLHLEQSACSAVTSEKFVSPSTSEQMVGPSSPALNSSPSCNAMVSTT